MSHQFQRLLSYTLVSLMTLAFASFAFSAAIYKYRDRKGVINYTNVMPKGITPQIVMVYCPACDPTSKVDFSQVRLKTTDFSPHIKAAIAKNPVDEALVRAIIQAESAYNPYALSKAGAQGLMQLMPGTAAQYGVSDSYDAQQNINGGVAYLRFLLDMFDGDVRLASAAYNAGENNVLKYAGVPPFAETQVYVQRVGQLYLRYRTEIAAREAAPVEPTALVAAINPVAAQIAKNAPAAAVVSKPLSAMVTALVAGFAKPNTLDSSKASLAGTSSTSPSLSSAGRTAASLGAASMTAASLGAPVTGNN